MIVDAFLGMVASLTEGFLALLPSWGLAEQLPNVGGFATWLSDINYFLPIGELFAVALAALALGPVFLGITLGLWVVALLRGGSSRG